MCEYVHICIYSCMYVFMAGMYFVSRTCVCVCVCVCVLCVCSVFQNNTFAREYVYLFWRKKVDINTHVSSACMFTYSCMHTS